MLQDFVDPKRYTYLPNTAGCFTAQDAVRTLRLAREAGGWNLVKLEVLGHRPSSIPTCSETFEAAEALLKDGFQVMVYCARRPDRRQAAGGDGLRRGHAAGRADRLGPRHPEPGDDPGDHRAGEGAGAGRCRGRHGVATRRIAMELGCDAVLMNTAIAQARDPVPMARAMKAAVEAGRLAYLAGRMPRQDAADPSSPLNKGIIGRN